MGICLRGAPALPDETDVCQVHRGLSLPDVCTLIRMFQSPAVCEALVHCVNNDIL